VSRKRKFELATKGSKISLENVHNDVICRNNTSLFIMLLNRFIITCYTNLIWAQPARLRSLVKFVSVNFQKGKQGLQLLNFVLSVSMHSTIIHSFFLSL